MGKLKRGPAREQIKEYILEEIFKGNYPPGFRLREKELAEDLGTSQAPVREALRELEGLQYVTTIPYKGTIVREVTRVDILVAYRLRGMLEQVAVEVICESEARDWSELREIALKVEEAAKKEDKEEYSKHDVEFHKYIVSAAETAMIEHMWKQVTFPIQVHNALDLVDLPLMVFSDQHMEIVKALEESDITRAGELLTEHTGLVGETIRKKLNYSKGRK